MYAAEKGHLSCLQTLLHHKALTDLKDTSGNTALMFAAEYNHPEIVGMLMANKADVNIKNNDKKTAFQIAEGKNNHDVIKILKAECKKDNLNKEMITAADEGKQRLVYGLITAGADLQTRDNDNNTCLHLSAAKGHESVVRILLQHRIDVNIRGKHNRTPMMRAADGGHHSVVKMLIRNGADLNLKDKYDGWTALTAAAFNGHTSIVLELMEERGADNEDKDILEALEQAKRKKHKDCVLILDRGEIISDYETAEKVVLAATELGCPNVVSDLLRRGTNMDTQNDVGETPFQIAARLPKTRKDEFENYLKEIERKREIKPTETNDEMFNVVKEAERKSRELAKVFLSQPLNSHDPPTISKYLFDIVNFVQKNHFYCTVFGDEQNFHLKYDKEEGKETLLQSVLNKGLVKQREEVLFVMKKVDLEKYPDKQENANYRLKKQVQKACSSSEGLRYCIKSIDEKYPWGYLKHKIMVFLSFCTLIMGLMFYGLDIYTDIRFSLDMLNYSKRNFTQEQSWCQVDFDNEFSLTIEQCRNNFNKTNCLNSLAFVKKLADDCFNDEQRFEDPNDWWIVGTVSSFHIALPFLIGFILWGVLQIGQKFEFKSFRKLPFPFVTRWFKYKLDKDLYRNYAWPDRNKDKTSEAKYEKTEKKCKEQLDIHDQLVNLSLIIESSIEASFQFFFQTVYVLPTIILNFTDVTGTGRLDWQDLFNWKMFSIVLSFASFAWTFYVIR